MIFACLVISRFIPLECETVSKVIVLSIAFSIWLVYDHHVVVALCYSIDILCSNLIGAHFGGTADGKLHFILFHLIISVGVVIISAYGWNECTRIAIPENICIEWDNRPIDSLREIFGRICGLPILALCLDRCGFLSWEWNNANDTLFQTIEFISRIALAII